MAAIAEERLVQVVKACSDGLVAVVRDGDGAHIVLLAGEQRCSSCVRQPCEHVVHVQETLNEGER